MCEYLDVFPPMFGLFYCLNLSAGVRKGGTPGALLSPGCVHLRQPGVRSPRGTDCNADVRGGSLVSSGGGTYPQETPL